MKYTTQIKARFDCSLERAFKTPMLSDVTKVHTGYGIMPKVSHCTNDQDWGKVGGSRRVFNAKNMFFSGGEAALDTVIERIENEYWKIEINEFKSWTMGFNKFHGEWWTSKNKDGSINVIYKYTMFSKYSWGYPFQWLFTKIIWRLYMKHALVNIKEMAKNNEPYVFD